MFTLAGATALEAMGGPHVKWYPGRVDDLDGSKSPPLSAGRMPLAARDAQHAHDVFDRLGMTEEETVALMGAHALGACHADISGYSGPWTRRNRTFSNEFYR